MGFLKIAASIVLAYIIWCLFRFSQSYHKARKIGLPICIIPIDIWNIAWRILSVPLRPFIKKYLPQWLSLRLDMATYGAEHHLRAQVVEKYGSVFVLCGVGCIQLWSANAELTYSMLAKPREIPPSHAAQVRYPPELAMTSPDNLAEVMAMVGPNIISSRGDSWQRQRKVIAPMINERISAATWDESIAQTKTMISHYQKAGIQGTKTSISGLKQVAFNVLGAVAYGKPQQWRESDSLSKANNSQFIETLTVLANNLVIAALLPAKLLQSPAMPALLQRVGKALKDFPSATDSLLAEERLNKSVGNNLMSTIVRFQEEKTGDSKLYLLPEEITGNLFVFTLAGFDTTANTMAFALALLAVHPQWQDWIQEEIDVVKAQSEQDYNAVFPQLKRVIAVMLETLRLYTPLVHALRTTTTPLSVPSADGTKTHFLPPGTDCQLSLSILHTNPLYWGSDSFTFNPSRWTTPNADGTPFEPAKGSFLPWSSGPRACPGVKMAQVEFVAVFYALFAASSVEPVCRDGEGLEAARRRLQSTVEDCQPVITLQINRPEDVVLRFGKR